MRIEVAWLSQEKRIIHIIYHAHWTWEDFEDHRRRAQALVAESSDNVAVIIEFAPNANLLPENALSHLSRAVETANPKMEMVVMVMPSPFWRVVITLLKRLLPNSAMEKSYIVSSFQAGLARIEEERDYSRVAAYE